MEPSLHKLQIAREKQGRADMTDLEEACARAIADWTYATQGEESDDAWDDLPQRDHEIFHKAARAVIPVVLEAAAEVARSYVGDRIGLKTGAKLEEAILALKPDAQS